MLKKTFQEKRNDLLKQVDEHASAPPAVQRHGDSGGPSDIHLVKRCQAGDASAYNHLIARYRDKVFSMIYWKVQNEQDAWDLTQEGFLKAWRSIHRFKGDSSFYTWLYRIMKNITIDSLRQKRIRGEIEFDDRIAPANVDSGSRTTPSSVPLPHSNLEQWEIRQRIDDAIAKLSPEHRSVFVMKEIEGLPYSEIAGISNCSIGTVMSRLFYARRKMQSLLQDVYENL